MNNEKNMKWYNFFNYVKLTISIVTTSILYAYMSYYVDGNFFQKGQFNIGSLISWGLLILVPIIYTVLLYKMYYREKDTYFYFIVSLLIDILVVSIYIYKFIKTLNNVWLLLLIFILTFAIWFIPNCIYIYKRKEIFKEDTECIK